jgi:hypothetical protein
MELRARGIQRLPGDQHGHDGRFARTGGELEGDPQKGRVRLGVQGAQAFELGAWRHLGQPDRGLRCFDLAEEQALGALRVPPVLQQPRRHRGDGRAQSGIAQRAPGGDLGADLVDIVVRLALAVRVLEFEACLRLRPVLGRRHRDDELAPPPARGGLAGGDAVLVEHPMVGRLGEWAVQDRVVDDRRCHATIMPRMGPLATPRGSGP